MTPPIHVPKVGMTLAFASILAGGVLADKGWQEFKAGWNSTAAGGGIGGGAGVSSNTLVPGAAPLPHGATKWERTDQGRDAAANPGDPITAIASGVVSAIIPFYQGQPAVVIDSPNLPGGATGIYYAEQISPDVHVGDKINAGQQIGTVAQSGTGLEFGFWKDGMTLAQATTGYIEGEVTQAGLLFDSYLTKLGVHF